MSVCIFDFKDYKAVLMEWIESQPHRGHGSKSIIARTAQCQTAYVSQVLGGEAHFSLEQAERLSDILELRDEEKEYFLLLVQKDRAGTQSLRAHFQKQIERTLEGRSQLKHRVKENVSNLNDAAKAQYFSSWIYSAVHLLVSIPNFSKRQQIAERLQLPQFVVSKCISFLIDHGLISESSRGKLEATFIQMHLPHDSPLISKHHTNWRMRAIHDLEIEKPDGFHFSSCMSISRADQQKLRADLLKAAESAKQMTKKSEPEQLWSLCFDFFEV